MGECEPLQYGMDLKEVQDIFMSQKAAPVLSKNSPPHAGRGLHSFTFRLNVSTFSGRLCVCGRGQ